MKKYLGSSIISLLFLFVLIAGFYLLGGSSLPETKEPNQPEAYLHGSVKIPGKLDFMGEPVPLLYNDVYESLDRELIVNAYFHSQTLRFLKLAPRFMSIVVPILKEEGVPTDFIYLALAESGFDQRAQSAAGAAGFWQMLKTTGSEYGLEVNSEVDERFHLEKSTRAACRFLKAAYQKFNNWTLVAASYNVGQTFIQRQLGIQKTDNYYDMQIGEETTRYVFRILALKLIMENPRDYGFDVGDDEKYPLWRTKTVTVDGPVASWPDFAIEHDTNYKILKMLNPWLRDNKLENKNRKTYEIKLPASGFRNKRNS